jgi:hypothetical protein
MKLSTAQKPTLYFIGVTTGRSSIMTVFPRWAEYLGLGDVEITGIDLALHDDPARYREVVEFIKHDPLSRGALVTTHKLDLYAAAQDLFDLIDPHARLMSETSCPATAGRTSRIACGRITSRMLCQGVSPIARAASRCPAGIAARPPRKISAM